MKKRILIADDDTSVRRMVARVLESSGYDVFVSETGSLCLASFNAAQPDLVVLDLKDPQPEGWETFEQMRRLDRVVPIIIITGWPNQQESALRRGAALVMEKPLDLPRLLASVEELIAGSRETERAEKSQRPFRSGYVVRAGTVP
jgi:DNA-binding response OmpR family regulator